MDKIIQDFKDSNFWRFIGLELAHIETGSVTLNLPITPSFFNVQDTVHGGIYASILDTAMGFTARSTGHDRVTTLEMNVRFLKAVTEGTIYCVGKVIHQNRSTALVQAELFNDASDLLAHSTGTFRVVNK